MKNMAKVVILLSVAIFATQLFAEDEWQHGIGTGLFALNLEGTAGLNTALFGPVQTDLDLDTSEISDVLETACGFGGFSKKGKWKILYSLAYMELAAGNSGTTDIGAIPVAADITFTGSGVDVAAVYQFAVSKNNVWGVLGGFRYLKHELDVNLTIAATPITRNMEHDWTDVLIGLTHDHVLSSKWFWNTRVDVGFGGSEGTIVASTGTSWKFADSWVASFFGKYAAIEFENNTRGDTDWYLYDVDEFGLGANVLYVF